MKLHHLHLMIGLLTGLVSTGCGGREESGRANLPVNVKVQSLSSSNTAGNVAYEGTITASKTIDLSFQVAGTILEFPVSTGQLVSKGQLIAAVDETTYRSQYNAQQAQAQLAKENYQRVSEVFRKGSVAEIKMLEAKSQYEQAAAAAKAVFQNIRHARLYAPQAGYIGVKRMETGATAGPGVPIVQLLDIASVNISFTVPENEINAYKKGEPASVTVEALGGKMINGTVDEVGILSLQGNPSYVVKVKLSNTDRSLKPGMLAKVSFPKKNVKHTDAILLPADVVQVDEKGHNFVYIADPAGKKAIRKNVSTGQLINNSIAITEGLNGTENLIISGYHKLDDQSPIEIVK